MSLRLPHHRRHIPVGAVELAHERDHLLRHVHRVEVRVAKREGVVLTAQARQRPQRRQAGPGVIRLRLKSEIPLVLPDACICVSVSTDRKLRCFEHVILVLELQSIDLTLQP